jgi:hypothetical protein
MASKQLARKEANRDTETCIKAVMELKEMVDRFLAQVTPLEAQVEVLSGTILDHSTELQLKELSLECTITTRDDVLHQNSRLTKKLDSM